MSRFSICLGYSSRMLRAIEVLRKPQRPAVICCSSARTGRFFPGTIRWNLWCLAPLFLLLSTFATARSKVDVITFKNGDHWTCEIKSLSKGYLYVSVDYVDGTVSVDWSKIAKIESPQRFVIEDESNRLRTGPLEPAPAAEGQPFRLVLRTAEGTETLSQFQVVQINQLEASFWEGLHGGINSGLQFTKSNSQAQFNFSANASYRKERWLAQAQYNTSFSGSKGNPSNLRNDLTLDTQRMLRSQDYFGAVTAEFLQSQEQQLDLRTTLGAGIGRMFKNTSRSQIYGVGGVVWTREKYSPGTTQEPYRDNAEIMLGGAFQFFRFKTANFTASIRGYPSITDLGRFRADSNVSMKFQLIKDLYWNFSIYANYDSRPPESTVKSDYGFSSGLGWTF